MDCFGGDKDIEDLGEVGVFWRCVEEEEGRESPFPPDPPLPPQ